MIYEYDITVTVEVQAGTEAEERALLKKFKAELFAKYGGDDKTRVTNVKRS